MERQCRGKLPLWSQSGSSLAPPSRFPRESGLRPVRIQVSQNPVFRAVQSDKPPAVGIVSGLPTIRQEREMAVRLRDGYEGA
jgi:hypothetical protein